MESYLDNSATTRVLPEVVKLMEKIYLSDFGNPSSLHTKGFDAERYITEARDVFTGILKCSRKEVFFTSGGTESNNTAILGTALAKGKRGHHMITTVVEHAAVSSPMRFLEERGWEIDRLSVDHEGRISLDELREKLRPDTVLVSIMHVNNEIGTIQPVEEAGKLIREIAPDCLFHVDDIQGFGKIPLIPKKCGIDFLSASSHKLHGPKGVGLLYMSERAHALPIIYGGGQQNGMRSGTENVPGVAGFAAAVKEIMSHVQENEAHMKELREYFVSEVTKIPDVTINGCPEHAAPHIVSVTIKDVRAEVLLHALEAKEIYVSAGSACSSNQPHVSETLKSIDVPAYALDSTVRISFSPYTKKEELEYTINALGEIVPALRRFTRK